MAMTRTAKAATQYITNGFEVLDSTEWPGSKIPIISVLGKKMYIPQGDQMRRMYYSMVRLARPCQKMLAYRSGALKSTVCTPGPIGYRQFETDEEVSTRSLAAESRSIRS